MPGYVIHLCIAKEYSKKYPICDEGQFKIIQFIEEISKYELHDLANRILENKDDKFLLK